MRWALIEVTASSVGGFPAKLTFKVALVKA
jgi:hypothetical protein